MGGDTTETSVNVMHKKLLKAVVIGLCISIGVIIFYIYSYAVEERRYKESVINFNKELTEPCLLLYGQWEVTKYMGGGMPGFSRGNEPVELGAEEKKRFSIFPDHVTVDGKTEYGEIYFLCRMIPQEWVYSFISPWKFMGNAETELKSEGQDFYLLGNIFLSNKEVEELLPPIICNNRIFIMDTDTIIVATIEGFYQIERVKNSVYFFPYQNKSILNTEGGYLDTKYQYDLKLYRLVYGKWKIVNYMEDENVSMKNKEADQIATEIEFNPEYLKIGKKQADGELYILCNLVPEDQIENFVGEQLCPENIKRRLKEQTADFYTIAKVLTKQNNEKMEELKQQIPGEGKEIYVIDSDTLVMRGNNGYFLLERIGYIDGVNEEELVEYMGEI